MFVPSFEKGNTCQQFAQDAAKSYFEYFILEGARVCVCERESDRERERERERERARERERERASESERESE